MEDYRRQAKIEALNKAFPGKSCGNPRCEELCAEAYAAAKSMRLDPADAVRRTIERELPCVSVTQNTAHSCRFGFMPPLEMVALGREEKKQEREDTIIHVFRTGVNECEKCQKLDGTRISPEDWADEERMKKKGFWKQINGEYLPHPHCKCHWELEIGIVNNETAKNRTGDFSANFGKPCHENRVYLKRGQGHTVITKRRDTASWRDHLTMNIIFEGIEDFLSKIENQNYSPHSIGHLIIIGHGSGDDDFNMGDQGVDQLSTMSDGQFRRLKKYLDKDSIVDIRMCRAACGEKGKKSAQYLANKLGCQVVVHEGYVSETGGQAHYILPWNAPELSPQNWIRPPYKRLEFFPKAVEKQRK